MIDPRKAFQLVYSYPDPSKGLLSADFPIFFKVKLYSKDDWEVLHGWYKDPSE